jgi:hypothetical protein
MTHPITPPPELVQQWIAEGCHQDYCTVTEYVAHRAAQWGADQELEACCEEFSRFWDEVELVTLDDVLKRLRTSRRPKPPSLKEQALDELDALDSMGACNSDTIRRALEQLDD